jgi:ribose transport system permease protein
MEWMLRHRWAWSAIGIVVLWLVLSASTSHFSVQNLSGVVSSAAFLVVVALGQMFVIASGGGNVDLSIASVITLSGFAAMSISNGTNAGLLLTLPALILFGAVVGLTNAFLIRRLRIPAMIATLAVGYVLASATLLANRGFFTFAVSPILATVATERISGIPIISLLAVLLACAAGVLIDRTVFGRVLMAVGQSERAAYFSGVAVGQTVTTAFLISGILAALDGALLSAHAGGAFLEMGTPYLLQSVGAVVVGGTLIFGGSATALGTLLGSVLLILIVTTMQIAGFPGGVQDMVQGAVIIAVLFAAGRTSSRRGYQRKS